MEGKTKKLEIIQRYIEMADQEKFDQCFKNMIEKSEQIGIGGNAEVLGIEDETFGYVCVKKISKQPQMICNTEEVEFGYQKEIERLGVRVPKLFAYMRDIESKEKYILMERIMGPSFEDILENRKPIPENYNHNSFWKKVSEYLKLMHNANIYHRDLHKGNIMIDKDGSPVIIDFGTATKSFGGDDNPYGEVVSVFSEQTGKYEEGRGRFQNDDSKAQWIKEEMYKRLQNI